MTQGKIKVAIGLNAIEVGTLHYEEKAKKGNRQNSAFSYSDSWLANENAFALSPSLGLNSTVYFNSGTDQTVFPGPIADSSPDAWGRAVITNASDSPVNELDMLLAVNDHTRMGALRFFDENGKVQNSSQPPIPRISTLDNFRRISRAFEQATGDRKNIARQLRGAGDSLGGMRPKSDYDDEGRLSLAKYTSERDLWPVEQMEVTALELAAKVGIRAPQARIERLGLPFPVAIIQRFDRDGDRRSHFVSARSFLGIDNTATVAYYTDIADEIRASCGWEEESSSELTELFRRIAFCILVSNTDDHLKNQGFLYAGRNRWILAPIFDVNPQPDGPQRLKTGISELSGSQASIEAAIEAAPFFDLSEDQAVAMVSRMATTISTHWKRTGLRNGLSEVQCKAYSQAFHHSEMTLALSYARKSH